MHGLWLSHHQNSCIFESTLVVSALNLGTWLHFIIIFFLILQYDHLCPWYIIHGFTALYFNGVSNSNILPWEDTQSFCKSSIAHQNNAQFQKLIFSVCDLFFTSIFTEEHFFISPHFFSPATLLWLNSASVLFSLESFTGESNKNKLEAQNNSNSWYWKVLGKLAAVFSRSKSSSNALSSQWLSVPAFLSWHVFVGPLSNSFPLFGD